MLILGRLCMWRFCALMFRIELIWSAILRSYFYIHNDWVTCTEWINLMSLAKILYIERNLIIFYILWFRSSQRKLFTFILLSAVFTESRKFKMPEDSTSYRIIPFSVGVGKNPKDAASVRATFPIPAACGLYYFEIRIISKGRDG